MGVEPTTASWPEPLPVLQTGGNPVPPPPLVTDLTLLSKRAYLKFIPKGLVPLESGRENQSHRSQSLPSSGVESLTPLAEVFHECGWQLADDLPYFGSRCCLSVIHPIEWLS
jgi:hypothetical protein